ncbi:hypothetical protein CW749_16920 [Vibrio sp. vnigr-6D03]|uniref:hypothetical protein n=1 Tax=Vibrio sp. vnigr-6D03 TaxID=2058088 RepID=UPI000C32F32B|nr:hypothetical protein [Vibrio sp. vnigr-6D03]PKF78228.1 hypothetical protein CW749_16920 [Vibrio sp. vnigr-6D03]
MPFNKIFWSLIALFCTSSAFSLTLEESLKQDMESAYEVLDTKYGQCRETRKNTFSINEVDNEWLLSLEKDQVGTAVYILSKMAFQRCVALEEGIYSTALLAYVAESGDKEALDEWLKFKRLYTDNDLAKIISKLDFNKLKLLSVTPPFSKPFNPLVVSELLKGSFE